MRSAIPLLLLLIAAPASGQIPDLPRPGNLVVSHWPTDGIGAPGRTFEEGALKGHEAQRTTPASTSLEDASEALADLVSHHESTAVPSGQLHCLAAAVYFEARGEPLAGQLAVGRVIIARAKSGRFPANYCGVVFQPTQFSFVRGNTMASIDTQSRDWREAVAIAHIAVDGNLRGAAEGALFFHAARVSPGWRLTRIAKIANHVFYR